MAKINVSLYFLRRTFFGLRLKTRSGHSVKDFVTSGCFVDFNDYKRSQDSLRRAREANKKLRARLNAKKVIK